MKRTAYIIEKARENPARIVLPENDDARVKEAARFIEKKGIARLIPVRAGEDPLRSAAAMVRDGAADAFVAGASYMSRDVIRAAIKYLGIDRSVGVVSGAFIMEAENCPYGENGLFVFADCAVIPSPSAKQLAGIASSSGDLLKSLFGIQPKIAFLTYSSKGSAAGESIDRAREAVVITRQKRPDFILDGELQFDAAVIPEAQKRKAPESPLKGRANVLIFPNLDAGNITYKAVERLGRVKASGPALLGLKKVCSDLSRGCCAEDIVNTVALTSLINSRRAQRI